MEIKSSTVFFLLSKQFSIVFNKQPKADNTLQYPQKYQGELLHPEVLYVLNYEQYIQNKNIANGKSLIITHTSPVSSLLDGTSGSVAFISEDTPVDDLMTFLARIFIDLQIWDGDFKQAHRDNSNLFALLDIGHRMFDYPIVIMDEFFTRIAYTSDYIEKRGLWNPDIGRVPVDELKVLFSNEAFVNTFDFNESYVFKHDFSRDTVLCKNVRRDGRYIARVVAHLVNQDISRGEIMLFDIIADNLAIGLNNYSHFRQQQNAEDPVRELMYKLLNRDDNTISPNETISALSRYSWSTNHNYTILLFEFSGRVRSEASLMIFCSLLESKTTHSKSIIRDGHVICMVNQTLNKVSKSIEGVVSAITEFVRENNCQVGISDMFTNFPAFANINDYYDQAQIALRIGQKKEVQSLFFSFNDYKIDYIMEQIVKNYRVEQLSHYALLTLIKYDELNKTEYVKTLYFYLLHNHNISLAADSLYIHRSTLLRRIEKIIELTDLNMEHMDDIIHLLVSYRLFGYVEIYSKTAPAKTGNAGSYDKNRE